jgi:virginiamycin B lyase
MDDQLLFEQFHATYEIEPRAGSFERLRATLMGIELPPRRRPWLRLLEGQSATNARSVRWSGHERPRYRPISAPFHWAGGFVAALLAVAVVAGLLYSRGVLSIHGPTTAGPIAVTTGPIAATPIPNGTHTEYAIPNDLGFAAAIATGPDRNLWFIDWDLAESSGRAEVGKMTRGGSFTEFSFAVPRGQPGPGSIVSGTDGNLWFTLTPTQAKVVRVTPSGSFTEFNLPSAGYTTSMAAGPDGNIWFSYAGKVAKMTPSGSLTEYAIPVASGHPASITAGPDGNLWFTETRLSATQTVTGTAYDLVKVTTSGRFTKYALPTAGYLPTGMAAGPDGNFWIAETQGGQAGHARVAKVSTSGTFTDYSIPSPGSFPLAITAGPDGNLWFIDGGNRVLGVSGPGLIVKVTTSGAFTEYKVGELNIAYAITTGPDGAIWFTESGLPNKIVRW